MIRQLIEKLRRRPEGVLLPGKMPESCEQCPCANDGWCQAMGGVRGEGDWYTDYKTDGRQPWCPLKPSK